jgi:hypothetical protein
MIKELENEFIGTGEVKGFKFRKLAFNEHAYLYEVSQNDVIHYEVFKHLKSPLCIDFDKRIYSEVDFREVYPKANSFGKTAFTFGNLKDAAKKMDEINNSEIERLKNK